MNLTDWLQSSGACAEGLQWARGLSPQEAWEQCNRPDWMLWALEELGYADQRVPREFACWCVRQVWELLTDPRSRTAVEVAERYARGEATAAELSAARAAAEGAAEAAAWAAARAAQANRLREVVPWSVVDELLSGVMEGMSNNG